jgi:hypothetical protein
MVRKYHKIIFSENGYVIVRDLKERKYDEILKANHKSWDGGQECIDDLGSYWSGYFVYGTKRKYDSAGKMFSYRIEDAIKIEELDPDFVEDKYFPGLI